MVNVIRLVLGLIAAFFIIFGLRFMLTPEAMAVEFFISPVGAAGLSTVRGDLGGAFLGIGTFIILGLRPLATQWLHAAALILGTIALGRVVGFAVDGAVPSAVTGCIVEVVFVVLLEIGARRLRNTSAGV